MNDEKKLLEYMWNVRQSGINQIYLILQLCEFASHISKYKVNAINK